MSRASLKSIAHEAGVSKTTASFVLNGKGDLHKINSSTQQRILKIAGKQNYQPSFLAQTLSSGKTKTIGVLVPDLSNYFSYALIQALDQKLENDRLMPGISGNKKEQEISVIRDFLTRQTDAIIAIAPRHYHEWKMMTTTWPKALVFAGFIPDSGHYTATVTLNVDSAVNQLIHYHYHHHKKAIGFIGLNDGHSKDIENAYHHNYTERFNISAEYHINIKNHAQLPKALHRLLAKRINALIFANPETALMTIGLIRNNIIPPLPGHLELSCIGWHPAMAYITPPIKSSDYHMGKMADAIIQVIRNHETETDNCCLIQTEPILIT